MIAFGPGAKKPNGWYVRIWPNPGLALTLSGGRRVFIRAQGKRAGVLRPKGK